MIDFTDLYCTDENVAIEAVGDYAALVSSSSKLAEGTDGVFDSGNRWLLTSATNDFAGQGVPVGTVASVLIRTDWQLFTVSDTTGGLLLRRCGLSDSQGLPPGPIAGSTGVQFKVTTCLPAITEATRWLKQRFRIPDLNALELPTDLRRAAVLSVLIDLFGTATRGKDGDNWKGKLTAAMAERDQLYTVLDRTYGLIPQARRSSVPVAAVEGDAWRMPPPW